MQMPIAELARYYMSWQICHWLKTFPLLSTAVGRVRAALAGALTSRQSLSGLRPRYPYLCFLPLLGFCVCSSGCSVSTSLQPLLQQRCSDSLLRACTQSRLIKRLPSHMVSAHQQKTGSLTILQAALALCLYSSGCCSGTACQS